MTFVLRMVGRETRASWRRLLFFFLCVALGVSAMAAVRSVIQSVRAAISREARSLTGADLVIQSNRAWDAATRATIDRQLAAGGAQASTDVVETATMVRPADESKAVARMVELQAVEAAYPFYGRLALDDGQPYRHALLRDRGILVRSELLAQLGVAVGDAVIIGREPFTIRGVIAAEPGRRIGPFTLGTRVLIDAADLPSTGLLAFGSRARFQRLVRVPEARLAPLAGALRDSLRTTLVTVRSYRDTGDRIGQQLGVAENYLGLVGYVMVVLGGIGVWSVTRVFIQQKLQSIAVLKCMGASVRQVLSVYVAQVLLLGAMGSALGIVLARLMLMAVPEGTFAAFGQTAIALTTPAALQAFGIGVLVSLLFALVPLLEVRRIRPLLLLRDDASAPAGSRIDLVQWGVGALVIGVLVLVAGWQAGSWRVGAIVSGGFVLTAVVLHLVGLAVVRLVRPLSTAAWFPLRHAVNGLGRPGHQTRVILLSVGLGVFFILGVRLLELNLVREFTIALQPDSPDLFLIDVQQDQAPALQQFLAGLGPERAPRLLPVLRARVTQVHGKTLNLDSVERVRERGSLAREFVVTYRDHLQANERLIDGQFWPPDAGTGEALVSIAREMSDSAGLGVGDRMRFDILGRPFDATVASVREVDWGDSRTGGFMFVFHPTALARAPHAYIATLRGPIDPVARARLQRDVVAQFPNVSVIDLRDVLRSLQDVLSNVTLGISVVGGVALLSGLLILIGAVAMTKFQRLREVALLKTLGASSRVIIALLVIEYGLLGAVAGAVGALAASALSWVVATRVLDIPWRPDPVTLVAAVALTAGCVGLVGVIASVDVLRRKPLAVLRAG